MQVIFPEGGLDLLFLRLSGNIRKKARWALYTAWKSPHPVLSRKLNEAATSPIQRTMKTGAILFFGRFL